MYRLRGVIDGRERFFPLENDEVRLGRGSDNDVVLPDFSVSRRHAALRREPGGWFVYDLKSTNGVQVNGVTVKKAPVRSADRLKIGIFEFLVEGELTHPPSPTAQLRLEEGAAPAPPAGAAAIPSISSATIVRRLADFSADYGLEALLTPERKREDKRKALDQAYGNTIFGILTRLARMLIKSSTVDEVLDQVLAIAFEALSVDRGFILLRNDQTGELNCEVSRVGDKIEFRPAEVPVSKTMLEAVMRERVALLTYDAQSDQRLATGESIRIHHIRSAMCAPLWSSDNIIGVMQVDSPFHAGTFNEGDLDLFTALANYAAVAVERIRYAERAEFERQVRGRLERYHSPAVIELVMSQGNVAEESVHRLKSARVTVLFADVVGFTPLAENLPPEEIADVLEGFFTHSVEAIFAHGGTLDKFIGDCVMAFFGAPMPQADHAQRAVRTAIDIQRSIKKWNDERAGRGATPLLSRIALNSGPVVVGDVGSNRRVDYTVLGNTVNVAARLEQAATGPGEIVIGGATLAELAGTDGEFRTESLGEFQLRGLVQKVPVYRVQWAE
ncbi:MAG TPA: adenylate/guanylate cyclase domain-containing protein [Thermoanaerobaculia bacterium]|jgi:adenylate cyclase|nr:adenylate/guanylate cyclase domain-containing protein [Thermoanaerobaculia bacterium]